MEIWKDIKNFEGLYQVSNHGNVKSFHFGCKQLTPKKNNKGYLWVELRKDGVKKQLLIHRLVAMHFIKNPHNYPIINHKDENPANNRVENLEWCTNSYNVNYFLNRHQRRTRTKLYDGKPRVEPPINQYSIDGRLIKTWGKCIHVRHEWNKNEHSIRECCLGKRKTAYGFKWAYVHSDKPQENVV